MNSILTREILNIFPKIQYIKEEYIPIGIRFDHLKGITQSI
jgi:hypothetical protein